MFVATQIAIALLLVHVAWIYFFVTGSLVQTPRVVGGSPAIPPAGSAEALLRVVVTTASGIALTGFVSFVLGLLHALYPATFVAWLALMAAAFALLGDSPLRASFWTARLSLLRQACSPGALVVYAAALVLAVPAILPETEIDPLYAYYVLATEWAHRHQIFVDYWRRYPYYAQNWSLIDAWIFELGAEHFAAFSRWLTGCLSLLGIYALIGALCRSAGVAVRRPWLLDVAGVLGAAALTLSPVFFRWLDTGMVDVPIGLFFFVVAACASMACVSRWGGWRLHFVLCAGFFIGLKTSLLVFMPMLGGIAYLIARGSGWSRRATAGAALAVVVLGAPWYVKNFIQAGDPIAPVLNLAVRGVDSKWTKEDLAGQITDLQDPRTPAERLRLPYDILEATNELSFREYGATLVLGLAVLPVAFVSYAVLRRRPLRLGEIGSSTFVFGALLAFAVGYWLQTSHLARYTLVFYPALAAFVPVVVLVGCARLKIPVAAGLLATAVAALPSSGGAVFYIQYYWHRHYTTLSDFYQSRETYLEAHIDGYDDAQYMCRVLSRGAPRPRRVYLVNRVALDFTFAQCGITALGDWFGPERYRDLQAAVRRGTVVDHLRDLDVDAVLVPSQPVIIPVDDERGLFAQLKDGGFTEVVLPHSAHHIFFAPGISIR
jgi:hypothetical protein